MEYWRSLEQMSGTPEVAQLLEQEFAGYDADTIATTSRRGFMKLMGAAMALAGITLTGCRRWPKEELAPYSSNPRGITPGLPEQYATAWELGGVTTGLLVTAYDGRPIKIEGNPTHPTSRTAKDKDGNYVYGSADAFAQASLLEMYDPNRSRDGVVDRRKVADHTKDLSPQKHTTWEAFAAAIKPVLADLKPKKGEGLVILSEANSSPSVAYQRKVLMSAYPRAQWVEWEPISHDNEREASNKVFGRVQRTVYMLDRAEVVVCLDADLLGKHPNHTRYANDWAQMRRSADTEKRMSRMHVAESTLSITGSVADVRIGVDPSRIYALAYAIAARLAPPKFAGQTPPGDHLVKREAKDVLMDEERKFVDDAVADLLEANKIGNEGPVQGEVVNRRGGGFVAIGHTASAEAIALVYEINGALRAVGNSLRYEEDTQEPLRSTYPDQQKIPAKDLTRMYAYENAKASQAVKDGAVFQSEIPTLSHLPAMTALTAAMDDNGIDTLLIIGGNPVYDTPADLNFAAALSKVPNTIHLSLYDNETSRACKWHLPRAHYLESWGDGVAWDGTVTLQQPIILPLFGGKSTIEVMAIINGDEKVTDGQHIVRRTYDEPAPETEEWVAFEKKFRAGLEAGFFPKQGPGVVVDASYTFGKFAAPEAFNPDASTYTLRFEQDSRVYDGRFANNGWLQETPDPLSKLMWENALLISVRDARALDLEQGHMVELTLPDGAKFTAPACIMPGQPLGVLGLSLGYGRTASGPIGDGLGFNSYAIRTTQNPWYVSGVKATKTGESYDLATSAEHHMLSPLSMAGEEYRIGKKGKNGKIIHEATLAEYKENPDDLGGKVRKVGLQLFQETDKNVKIDPILGRRSFTDLHAWGMTIDLTACVGCNACALACQAENNIPVVGKEQCLRHREMNWIRIDRYFRFEETNGGVEDPNPEVVFQPMTCQHCENAPCEQVCPVAATLHDSEGLNTMVYNRCIGTRYCSNNCPYKVRRFNYFDFHSQDPRSNSKWLKKPFLNLPDLEQMDPEKYNMIKRMVFNPEVTVRMRGVMEKCTYCVQRIHLAVIAKRGQGGDVVDGDIITACQQACPTQAIIFGNLNDPESQVSKLQRSARAFDVLHEELNTRPRTRYLAKLRNPVEA
ncbi:MAG TPA: TAT-variant-translocated molybdopterin oxidoreductase [Tepidisphaeraceae bacterium]|jgi:molybdopterin-containing oxidoreductase family iron-sulfur binding subunit|nr:TAT-variant-translocated molybdopterin oxidoreductase [Tepidisphaeraceae bacterium]